MAAPVLINGAISIQSTVLHHLRLPSTAFQGQQLRILEAMGAPVLINGAISIPCTVLHHPRLPGTALQGQQLRILVAMGAPVHINGGMMFGPTGLHPRLLSSAFQGQQLGCGSSNLVIRKEQQLRILAAGSKEGEASEESVEASGKGGLFGFVTDNKSSRGSIQLPNSPAQDGNLGQMITEIENKGREYGSYARAGEFTWWVRKTGPASAKKGTVVLLHGSPSQSYSYRDVLKQLADVGYQCYAPDWIGYGFSEKPQPGYDFAYTEEAYHEEFDKLLIRLKIDSPFFLLTQGFLVGSYGLTWALKNSDKVLKLAVLNGPLTASAPLPGLFQQLRFPLLGEFTSQNAILPERFIEKGGPYVLELNDADVYRLPYLNSSDAGFSLLESARKAPVKDITSRIAKGFSSQSWKVPTLVAWGEADKYLAKLEAEEFVKSNPEVIKATFLGGAGHLPQEDWPEKVVQALIGFFK